MKRLLILVTFTLAACVSSAATPAETNAVGRALMMAVLHADDEDNIEDSNACSIIEPVETWARFLSGVRPDGWSDAAKRSAFLYWLASLGTTDCTKFSSEDWAIVLLAIQQCDALDFREAAPALKALADNPKGVFREEARRLWQKWQPQE